ncbi:MAG: PKD domain-containing protein [Cytophagales bacterium]|nr:PKD domain-containing protein [Cytophagales bacterium]
MIFDNLKMKKIIFVFPVLIATIVNAQITFQKTFGGNNTEQANLIQKTNDGGYALIGYTNSFGAGSTDMYLIKTDSLGNLLWSKTYGGWSGEDFVYGIQTNDGGFIMTTHTHSFGPNVLGDILLVKTDSSGSLQWSKHIGGNSGDAGYFVNQTSENGYIVTGYSQSFGAGNGDIYLLQLDSLGNLQWTKTIGGSAFDYGVYVEQTNDNGYIILGTTGSFGVGSNDICIFKTDSIGNLLWFKTYGGTDWDKPSFMRGTKDGGYIIAGETASFGVGFMNILLLKVDSLGNLKWSKTYGDSITFTDIRSSSIQQTEDNGFIFTGNATHFSPYKNYVLIVKTDSIGNLLWNTTTGERDFWIRGPSVLKVNDGGFIMAGETVNITGSGRDIHFLKTDSLGNTGCGDSLINLTVIIPTLTVSDTTPFSSSGGIDSIAAVVEITPPTECQWLCPKIINISSDTSIICQGDSVQLNASGGISYNWTPGYSLSDSTIANPVAFPDTTTTYIVTILDAYGCKAVDSVTISELPSSIINIIGTDVNCNGANDGNVDLTVSGNSSSYIFSWSNGANTEDISGLLPGIYIVTVADSLGCVANDSVIIGEPPALNTSIVSTGVSCKGESDGAVDLTLSGGVPPYTYNWSSGDTTEDISGLSASTYSVSITDSNNCIISDTASIFEPSAIILSAIIINAGCYGSSDGAIDLTVSGGTPLYSFSWSNGDTTKDITNILAGTYIVTVTDSNDCIKSDTIVINQPDSLNLSATSTDANCGVNDGLAFVTVSGGTSPYSYLWSNGDTNTTTDSLFSGGYSVIVTDSNGCADSISVTVNSTGVLSTANFSYIDTNLTVNFLDSSANAISWSWDFGDGNTDTIKNPIHIYNSAGNYTVCLSATNLCGSDTICNSVIVTCPIPAATFSYSDSLLTLSFSDSSKYATSWLWDFGDGNTDTVQNPTHTYISSGTYNVCFIAENACKSDSTCQLINVTSCIPPIANFGYGQSNLIMNFFDSSISADSWWWDFGDGITDSVQNPLHSYKSTGTYNVCLTVSNLCGIDSICGFIILELTENFFFIPNAFSPNGDGVNDILKVIGNNIKTFYLVFYNRWGEKIFETREINKGWEGKYKGKKSDMAVFVYYLEVEFLDGEKKTEKGDVTLIR